MIYVDTIINRLVPQTAGIPWRAELRFVTCKDDFRSPVLVVICDHCVLN